MANLSTPQQSTLEVVSGTTQNQESVTKGENTMKTVTYTVRSGKHVKTLTYDHHKDAPRGYVSLLVDIERAKAQQAFVKEITAAMLAQSQLPVVSYYDGRLDYTYDPTATHKFK